jgi:DNA repair protein RadC
MKQYKSNVPEYSLKILSSDFKKVKIQRSKDSADYIRQFYSDDIGIYESFFMILLNSANNTTGWVKISQGGINGTVADPRLIAKYAIETLASSVIIAHNHPTGNMNPSHNDIELTKVIKKGLKLFEVTLLDHIIIGPDKDKYYSFADESLI